MATIFEADHDSGGTPATYWASVTDSGARMSITAPGLNSTAGKISCTYAAADPSALLSETGLSPPASDEMRFRIFIDTNGIDVSAMGVGDVISIHRLRDGNAAFADIVLQADGSGGYQIEFAKRSDSDGSPIGMTTEAITDGEHCCELAIIRSSAGAPTADGSFVAYLDGVQVSSAINQPIFTRFNGFDNWLNSLNATGTNATGTLFFDEAILTDDASTALCPIPAALDQFSAAAMRKPVDIDADGDFIYIAMLDSLGEVGLIKFSTALDSDGTRVFEPGAGSDIGVQCGRFDADTVWIAGDFDSSVVQKSEDGGTSFTVKDTGFAAVKSFIIGPDDDRRVMVALANSILETINDGVEWLTRNSAVGYVVKALSRLDINVQESVTGGDAGNIGYSPNSGSDIEDLSAGFPASDVTGVIAGKGR